MIEQLFPLAAAGALAAAAWSDFRTFRISNLWPLVLILLFGGFWLLGAEVTDPLSHLAHFGIALVVGMVLFALKWIGGGDAKLYAAVALWFPLSSGPALVFATTMAGLVLAVFYVLTRRWVAKDKRKDRRIAYGVAIAFGAVLCWLLYPTAAPKPMDVNELGYGTFKLD
jgi:prepilin peptidase CpaA